jgi:signal transduction histidine kinase/ActR/RegA family two-component response regulator
VRCHQEFTAEQTRLLEFTGATLSNALARKQSHEDMLSLERQLRHSQKMEAVGLLAGGVAHDFNNMLFGILGTAEMLLRTLPEVDPTREAIKTISEAAGRAADLTRQLLAFSRKQVIEPRRLDLNRVIENLHPMLARLIGEHIRLTTTPAEGIGPVLADQGQVEQVVLNLVVNARDAMPGGGDLVIETADVTLDDRYCAEHVGATPGRYVMLAVSDTGHGMDTATLERIFEPFFSTKELGRGTGLGLATVHGIVQQSGGSIQVYSEPGRGSSFKVYYPVHEDPEAPEASARQPVYVGGNETVLVAEDEEVVRTIATKMLTHLGYRVLEAGSGAEAIALARQHAGAIDLLLTDVVMPDMNGRELAEHLRTEIPSMRILFTSGYTDNVIAHHGVVDEGVEFIAKPYDLATLARRLREILDREG